MENRRLSTDVYEVSELTVAPDAVAPDAVTLDEEPVRERGLKAGILIALALVSMLVLGNIFSNPEMYGDINTTLDEKKVNVMAMAATTTAASAAITALPGDTGTPIADKLVDFSSYLMIILAVIYLEKFLLTTLGFLAFVFIIPVGLVLFAVALWTQRGGVARANLRMLGTKLTAFGVAVFLVVPASVWLTNSIDATYAESLAASNAAIEEATHQLEESSQQEEQQDQGLLGTITGAVQSGIDTVTQGAQNALDSLGNQLNTMIDTIAVMIVTSCLIPLLVLILFLQLVKLITGLDFGGATAVMDAARAKGRSVAGAFRRS